MNGGVDDVSNDGEDALHVNSDDRLSFTDTDSGQLVSYGSIDSSRDFSTQASYLIFPEDNEYLTDYLLLLFGQVKRGVLNEVDQSKANRSCKLNLGFRGMRCRHCGGNERVSQIRKYACKSPSWDS